MKELPSDETKSLALSLVDSYSPKSEIIEITLPKGDVLRFKNTQNVSELAKMRRGAENFVKQMKTTGAALGIKDDVDALDDATLKICFVLGTLSEDMTPQDFITLAVRAGTLFTDIRAKVDLASLNFELVNFDAQVEQAKKDSPPPQSSDSA